MMEEGAWGHWEAVKTPPRLERGVVHVWCCFLEGPAEEARSVLSPDERRRADRFGADLSRERFTLRRAFLRRILALYLHDVAAEAITFSYGPVGKPFLSAPALPLEFNQADSGPWTVVAVTPGSQVGVDVEVVRSRMDMDVLAGEVFTERERRELAGVSEIERRLAFFHGWTRKEAAIKADGGGLAYPLRDIEVSLDPRAPARIYRFGSARLEDWSIIPFEVDRNVVGAVMVADPAARIIRLRLAP